MQESIEGKAKLRFGSNHSVFYNPKMALNRDLSVLLVKSFFRGRRIRICDPMTATGVRAIRYASECPNVESVAASDVDPTSATFANRMIELNNLTERITVTQANASSLMRDHMETGFNLVDLDPFGSPSPYFESALRCIAEGGILASTATDMAPLTGARSAACFRKYGVVTTRTEFEKETAIRILAACLTLVSGRLQLGVKVIFSHASDHYVRLYAQVNKGKQAANTSIRNLGFLEYCSHCLRRVTRQIFEENEFNCNNCGAKMRTIGPLWLGKLWDPELVVLMNAQAVTIDSSRLTYLQTLLDQVSAEMYAPPFYHRIDRIAHNLRINPPRVRDVVSTLRSLGYMGTLTHFHPNAFRTDAPDQIILGTFDRSKKA